MLPLKPIVFTSPVYEILGLRSLSSPLLVHSFFMDAFPPEWPITILRCSNILIVEFWNSSICLALPDSLEFNIHCSYLSLWISLVYHLWLLASSYLATDSSHPPVWFSLILLQSFAPLVKFRLVALILKVMDLSNWVPNLATRLDLSIKLEITGELKCTTI